MVVKVRLQLDFISFFISVEYRDQGLTRPKVLVVVPTRHGAFRVISLIISLLSASDQVSTCYLCVL